VLFEIPVAAATVVNVMPRWVRSRCSRGPTWSSAAAMAASWGTLTAPLNGRLPGFGNDRCRARDGSANLAA
jgi:hypothetical protein